MPEVIYQPRGPDVFQQVGNEADVPVQPDVGDVICLRPVHIKVPPPDHQLAIFANVVNYVNHFRPKMTDAIIVTSAKKNSTMQVRQI